MAIGFARIEFVKRSSGKNSCAKAAYNSRSSIEFNGTEFQKPTIYDWSSKEPSSYHEVLLPKGANEQFKSPKVLWNHAEKKETRINSVTAFEFVLALPDDKVISLENRIHLVQTFIKEHFIEKGLAAQIDIHAPERVLIISCDNQEQGLKKGMRGNTISRSEDQVSVQLENGSTVVFNPKEFTGYIEKEHNWHAHVQISTRRFKSNGLEFEDHKARDIVPRATKGRVISGPDWGKLWTAHQNQYFQQQGIDLRVDEKGIIPQEHLGPYRMRGRAFSLFEEHHRRLDSNQLASKDPEKILEAITVQKSVFTKEDVDRFLFKHIAADEVDGVLKDFYQQTELVQLADKQSGEPLSKYTSKKVLEEEQKILRLADRIHAKESFKIHTDLANCFSKELNQEQKKAFEGIILGKKLSLIHGYAGTGKSYLLKALHSAYEESGYRVRALGPDNATSDILREKGLPHTENVYRFLYALHNDRRKILKGKEVWILDEAGKLGNRAFLEFLREAEKKNVKVVLSGDIAQMPPVERGGMFKVFCEQYSSQILEDIQRQKVDKQLEIARSLAKGEFGSAIDKLSKAHGLYWSENKREAMEELITRWAQNTRSFPQSTTLIIAHTNKEVRVLNEMVRLIRKQRGELGEKEFQCPTSKGDIYISVGDSLLFLGNNKELGLTNGLSGTLIEATSNRFVVSIQSEDHRKQTVAFDPQKYHAYQLGYASTFYRSQGRTVDRAYVLHSAMMNKEMFYVGLTRHVRDVSYFVSKNEVYCLSDLKRQAVKSSSKALTIEYTTLGSINAQKESYDRFKKIQDLKQSESILNRVKGYGLETWDHVVNKATETKENIQDRFPSREFYRPSIPDSLDEHLPVTEVEIEGLLHSDPLSEEQIMASVVDVSSLKAETKASQELSHLSHLFDTFDPKQKALAFDYLRITDKATALKIILDAETEASSRDIRFSSHFKMWQEACGLRNQAAYELVQKISSKELEKGLHQKSLAILQEQAGRYESFLAKKEGIKQQLDEQLKTHLEPLLHRLYPDGPTSRNRTSFRFGSKGALSVVHSGAKAGQFFDFEQNEGGGLLKLIQRELGLGKVEAKTWAQDFLSIASEISIPKTFARPSQKHKAEDSWVSLRPDSKFPAPTLAELKGGKLGLYYNEVARHSYKDENGQILYYVLRLADKNDPEKKSTPPLSYGYWKSNPGKIDWELKGFQAEKRSLYNLHLLKENLQATVLVVEGEKTADLALKKLPGHSYVCITWPGGAGSVQKADWMPLQGRKVLIWPDNDPSGYEAGNRICHELKKIGVASIQLVNKEELKRHFPEKWDLADPLPTGTSENLIEKILASAEQKGINPEQIMHRLGLDTKDPVQKARINEILWRVDDRLRPTLEEKHGMQFWKTHEEILKETARILFSEEQRKGDLKEKFGVNGMILERLNYQISIQEAQQGRKLRMAEINLIKTVIQQHGYIHMQKTVDKKISDFMVDKMLNITCDEVLKGISCKDSSLVKPQKEVSSTLQQVEKQIDQYRVMKDSQDKEIRREKDISMNV